MTCAVAVAAPTTLLLASNREGSALLSLGRRLATWVRRLLAVVLFECPRLLAELEERHFTLGSLANAKRNDRGADAGPDVYRALWIFGTP